MSLTTSTVGYSSDNWASCMYLVVTYLLTSNAAQSTYVKRVTQKQTRLLNFYSCVLAVAYVSCVPCVCCLRRLRQENIRKMWMEAGL